MSRRSERMLLVLAIEEMELEVRPEVVGARYESRRISRIGLRRIGNVRGIGFGELNFDHAEHGFFAVAVIDLGLLDAVVADLLGGLHYDYRVPRE